jgi:hypothetical protein
LRLTSRGRYVCDIASSSCIAVSRCVSAAWGDEGGAP